VEYEAEFAAALAEDFLAASAPTVTKAVGSVDWVAFGNGVQNLSTYADVFKIDSSGLVIAPKVGFNYWSTAIQTAKFGALISDLVAAGGTPWNYLRDTIALQLHATAGSLLDSNWQLFGLGVDVHTAFGWAEWCAARNIYDGQLLAGAIRAGSSEQTIPGLPVSPMPTDQPDFFEVVLGPRLGSAALSVGNWQGSFPEPLAVPTNGLWSGAKSSAVPKDAEGANPATGSFNSTNARFEIVASRPGTPNAFTVTAHKVRVLRLT
jgi:hypothetical protein